MAYTQRFGLSRKSPVALIGKKEEKVNILKSQKKAIKKILVIHATDIINKNLV